MTEIPIVDLADPDPARVRGALRRAFEEVGFMVVTGHGVDRSLLAGIVDAAHGFFALSDEEKRACAPRRWNASATNRYRGYFPSDVHGKEGLDLGDPRLEDAALLERPFYERNVVPARLGAAFADAIEAWFAALTPLGVRIVREALAAIDAAAGWVDDAFERPAAQTTLRFNRYPTDTALASPDPDAPALFCEAHFDSDVLTLLHQDQQGGLQVRTTDHRWVDVPYLEGAFVVNSGRALQILSGDRYPATVHRVVPTAGARLSIPFFLEPRWDARIGDETYERYIGRAMSHFPEYADR
ncbi:MAG: 2OG-Fe(II) oxygenase family protein [Myxococcota bacterium]